MSDFVWQPSDEVIERANVTRREGRTIWCYCVLGEPQGNLSSLENPSALDEIAATV